jgi:DNA replication protein DnaC
LSLTNTQYEAILHEYEQKQIKQRHDLAEKLQYVYLHADGYQKLDQETASLSTSFTRRLIDGDEAARTELSASLKKISREKALLLQKNGLPPDYLQPQYECPDCQDTGYAGSVKCHCFEQREISLLYSQSHIKDVLERENFSSLSYQYFQGPDLVNYQKTVQICRQFVETFDSTCRNLLFTGTVGTGKTFLCNCIAKDLIDSSHSVIYFSSIALFDTLSKNVFDKNKEGLYSLYNDLYKCDLVIIDDLGTELSNSFVSSYFFAFLNERQLRGKSTIITTNLNLREIEERYSDRTCSRIISHFDVLLLSGKDIRIHQKT